MVTFASTRLSIVRGRPLRGVSWSTSRMCACSFCRYFLRTLSIVPRDTPHRVVRAFSGLSSSRSSKCVLYSWPLHFWSRGRQTFPRRLVRLRFNVLLCAFQAYSTPSYGGEYTAGFL